MRVPGIFQWSGKIPEGVVQQKMASTMDVFTTVVKLVGAELPNDRPIDGSDISPILFGKAESPAHEPFFYYRGAQLFAARLGEWKAHFITQGGYGADSPVQHEVPLLFNLGEDPGEHWDKAAKHPEIVTQIREAVARHQSNLSAPRSQLIDVEAVR